MATKYERETTFKTTVTYTSGSTNIDCSGNVTNLRVYDPNGTLIIGPVSGTHTSTGVYHYYVSTQSTHDLGLYICEWTTYFSYGSPWNWQPKVDREIINLVKVK